MTITAHRLLCAALLAAAASLAACATTRTATAQRSPTVPVTGTAGSRINTPQVPSSTATAAAVTPPSATPTAPPTATRVPTTAPTPTFPPGTYPPDLGASPTPIATPGGGASAFHLKPWTDQDALGLVHTMVNYSYADSYVVPFHIYAGYTSAQEYVKYAAQEGLLRFPTAPFADQLQWQRAHADAIAHRTTSDQWILQAIATQLNQGGLTLDTLPRFLWDRGFQLNQLAAAPNLLGDGRLAHVLWISTQDGGFDGLYAAAIANGRGGFTLQLIRSHWDLNMGEDDSFLIGDHTGNGQPEVLLRLGTHNGSFCSTELDIDEWHADHFDNLSAGPGNAYGIYTDDCSSTWQYGPADSSGLDTIETSDPMFVDNLWLTRRYRFNGARYQLADTLVEPPPDYSVFNTSWVRYALEDGQYDAAGSRIQNLLSAWPQAGAEGLGPSFSDYLRFLLAQTYALRAQPDPARATLQDLIAHPANPLTTTVSSAAQAYLKQYTGDGSVYAACQAALLVMQRPLANLKQINSDSRLKFWGYDPATSFKAACSLRAAFRQVAGWLLPDGATPVPQQLRAAGVSVHAAAAVDANGDGRPDWVVAVDTPGDSEQGDLWLLLATDHGFAALAFETPLARYYQWQPGAALAVQVRQLPGVAQPAIFIQLADQLAVFNFSDADGTPTLTPALPNTWISANVYTINAATTGTMLAVTTSLNCVGCDTSLRWDPATQTFLPVRTGPPTPDPLAAVWQAEASLFAGGSPAAAAPVFAAALKTFKPSDQALRPRVLYDLALASELSGDTQTAIATYWQIWHDAPGSGFALMARQKLVPAP